MTWTKYKLAPIASFRYVQNALIEAHENKQLVVIIGATGFGKSVNFNHYVQNTKDTYCIRIKPAEAAKPFFVRMIDLLNDTDISSNDYRKPDAYLNWLVEQSSFDLLNNKLKPFLIVDEAGNFKKNSQSYLRQVWDNIKDSSGMVISGPARYQTNLNTWNKDLSSGIPELVSRINKWIQVPVPTYDDIKLICRKNQIEDKKVFKFIFEHSENLRNVKNFVVAYHNGSLII